MLSKQHKYYSLFSKLKETAGSAQWHLKTPVDNDNKSQKQQNLLNKNQNIGNFIFSVVSNYISISFSEKHNGSMWYKIAYKKLFWNMH